MGIFFKKRFLFLLLTLLMISGCGNSSLTWHENAFLQLLKMHADPEKTDSVLYFLINYDPAILVSDSVRNKDFRPIGIAMGYEASEKDAQLVAIKCSSPVEGKSMTFGCGGTHPAIMKLAAQYNITLINRPDFPYECEIDPAALEGIEKFSLHMEEEIRKDHQNRIDKWATKEKARNNYNH